MKKGDIYEGIVEKIEFPNKGILHIDGERVVVEKCHTWPEDSVCYHQAQKGKVRSPDIGDTGAFAGRTAGEGLSSFWDMRRLYLPEPAL